jgi:MFS family permease
MLTSIVWGRLSDTYGRKPVILLGLAISVTANLAFGFSKSIGSLLFWRIVAGMANGILGVMRTMTAEIVKERRYQTRAFLALPLIFNAGRVVALAIGGCLADPVHNMSWLFGPTGIFNFSMNNDGVAWAVEYPYALPAIFNGTVLTVCLVLAALGLKESLSTRERNRDIGLIIGKSISGYIRRRILGIPHSGYTAIEMEERDVLTADVPIAEPTASGASTPTRQRPLPTFREIWTPHLLKTLLAFGLLPLHNATFLHVFPVFLSMPILGNAHPTLFRFAGGLGLAPPTVGVFLAILGICGIMLQLFIYPRIQKRIGTIGALRLANSIFPLAYIFAPFLSLLAEHATAKWSAMVTVLFLQVMARTMAIPSTVILLTEAAPRRSVLGSVHGTGNTLSAFASAIGPVIGGVLLARGIDAGSVGIVWWCWLLVVALGALAWSFVLDRDYDDRIKTESE